ncbi:MAG: hypothetical protein HeimC2_19380 [Candidatus Heimdallarchaeota archaeon LC_2]|nr:MAG: hypothetical protein HeimC2_19380 [Candidatus Heimdallarchaeota archaeon LC_2]
MTTEENQSKFVMLPPLSRFLVELTAWIWFIVAGFWYLTIISMLSFSLMNFDGDKKPVGSKMPGILIKGWQRIGLEWIWGWIGVIVVYLNFDLIYFIIQLVLVLLSQILDRHRYYWMLGKNDTPPKYVIIVHK